MKPELVLYNGPPFVGKTLYYLEKQQDTHKYFCLSKLYKENKNLNLRQILLKISVVLKNGSNVVIDDENNSCSQRASFIKYMQQKVPSSTLSCLVFSPNHGIQQLLWCWQYALAENFLRGDCENEKLRVAEQRILSWEREEQGQERPSKEEAFILKNMETNIRVQSKYMFEVPVLLVEWSSIVKDQDGELVAGVGEALVQWYQHNPCGRMVILRDQSAPRQVSQMEMKSQNRFVLKELTKAVGDAPVYLLAVNNVGAGHSFRVPPQPGPILFLQRLMHLDLYNKGSMILYKTATYTTMAEAVGMQHIKASKVFQHPRLMVSMHATVKPPKPKMALGMEVVPPIGMWLENCSSTVPLYDEMCQSSNLYADEDIYGYTLSAAYKDVTDMERYQKLYEENVTPVTEKKSKIQELQRNLTLDAAKKTSESTRKRNQSTPSSSSLNSNRQLPKWMFTASTKTPKKQRGLFKDESPSSSLDSVAPLQRSSSKEARYLMNTTELIALAKDILFEAGLPLPEMVRDGKSSKQSNAGKNSRVPQHRKTVKRKPVEYEGSITDDKEMDTDHVEADSVPRRGSSLSASDVEEETTKEVTPAKREAVNIIDDLFDSDAKVVKKRPPRRSRIMEDKCPESVQAVVDDLFLSRSPVKRPKKTPPSRMKYTFRETSNIDNSQFDLFDSCDDNQTRSTPIRKQATFDDDTSDGDDTRNSRLSKSTCSKQWKLNPAGANSTSHTSYLDSDTGSDCLSDKKVNTKYTQRYEQGDRSCVRSPVCVPESISYQYEQSRMKDGQNMAASKQSVSLVADSYVPDTVTTIPETVCAHPSKQHTSGDNSAEAKKYSCTKDNEKSHLSVLDDLF